MKKVIIVAGNVIDGLSFIGPFDCVESAIECAANCSLDEWCVGELEIPEVNNADNE